MLGQQGKPGCMGNKKQMRRAGLSIVLIVLMISVLLVQR
jgi:hypothetical protein